MQMDGSWVGRPVGIVWDNNNDDNTAWALL